MGNFKHIKLLLLKSKSKINHVISVVSRFTGWNPIGEYFFVEFNNCGQQFSGKSWSTGQYAANNEDKIDGLLGEHTNGALFFSFISFVLNMHLFYYGGVFFPILRISITQHVI